MRGEMMARHRFSLDHMVFPDGRKPGVKRDKPSRIMDRCDPVKTQIETIDRKYWDELADTRWHKNRRSRYRFTLDQNGFGSCAWSSAAAGKGALDEHQNLPRILYNAFFGYHWTSGGRDGGSVIGDNVTLLQTRGCCPEEVWPSSNGWRTKPSAEAQRIAKFFRLLEFFYAETIEEVVSALLQGYDIHAGYSGHAVIFNRYKKRGKVEFKNSWGNWGDDGFGELSLSKIYFPYGAYAYKNCRVWTPEEWAPRHDQVQLAMAVEAFMQESMGVSRPWSKQKQRGAADTYKRTLEAFGIAT